MHKKLRKYATKSKAPKNKTDNEEKNKTENKKKDKKENPPKWLKFVRQNENTKNPSGTNQGSLNDISSIEPHFFLPSYKCPPSIGPHLFHSDQNLAAGTNSNCCGYPTLSSSPSIHDTACGNSHDDENSHQYQSSPIPSELIDSYRATEQQQLLRDSTDKTANPQNMEQSSRERAEFNSYESEGQHGQLFDLRSQSCLDTTGTQRHSKSCSSKPDTRKQYNKETFKDKKVNCLEKVESKISSNQLFKSDDDKKHQTVSTRISENIQTLKPLNSNNLWSNIHGGNPNVMKEIEKNIQQLNQFVFPNCPSQDLYINERMNNTTSENRSKVATIVQDSEIVAKDLNSNSEKRSVVKGKLTECPRDGSDEVFFDAPEIPINQLSKLNRSAGREITPYLKTLKLKFKNSVQKRSLAPDSNKQLCTDKKQFIKKKVHNSRMYYSARFLSHYSVLAAQGGVSYEIIGKRNLLIAESDNFIARIEVAPGEELNFAKSFRQNKTTLISRVTIVKILEDELLVQRNEAYKLFKKILTAKSENISDFQEFAEDFLQISIMLKTYNFFNNKPHLLLQEMLKNQYISHELKSTMEHLFNFETKLQKRNKLFPRCTCPTYSSLDDLFSIIQDIRRNALRIHKQNLIKKCSTQNSYLLCRILEINRLPSEKLLRITNDDIKLFTDLMTLTNEEKQSNISVIPLEFIDNLWSRFYSKLVAENSQSLQDSGSLSHPIYFFLVKSLRDLITDISNKSTTTAPELFKKVRNDFVITRHISWSLNSSANKSLEKQYKLVYELMKHFEPGNYSNKNKFGYRFVLLEDNEDTFWRSVRGLVVRNRNELLQMPEERLIWLYIVDAGIAPIIQGESDERFKKLSLALLTGFLKFVQKAKHIRYEFFRVAAHNIIKFAAQLIPYFQLTNSVSQDLDHSILDKQVDFMNGILVTDEQDNITLLFSSLMEVYIEYWELRESIIGRLPLPCHIFKGLVDDIMMKILEIVDSTLSKQVEMQYIIQYFRLFNEFVKHFKGINFAWFISKSAYFGDMKQFVSEIKKGDKITYKVMNPAKFLDILHEKGLEPPKHFLIETVSELLRIINVSLNKSDWSDENQLKAAGDLFLAIGHSFAHFEDQTDYTDIELFLRDCTTPFKSVVENSHTYSDFKIRLENVENYYLYTRKQNQIGIERALDLCDKEVEKAKENGFHTKINRKTLEECFNRYSEKLALLQNLDIRAILKDLRKQLKNVDVLPCDRWTPHFKQTILPVLLANLSAIWTILESKDVAHIEKRIEPHCVQIVCILRLIGVDYLENGVPKHFAQVLTGQGKSIILALLSSLFTLTGHKANIVCYSRYLAMRDRNAFDTFFKTFDRFTGDCKTKYYTFDNMMEDALTRKINGEKVNLRKAVNDLILNKLETRTVESSENPADSVLLIDEVDIFFSDNYYGETYNPCSTIGMDALREIQPKLWEIVEGGVYEKKIVLERIRDFINELLKDDKHEDFKNFLSWTSTLFEENLDKMVSTAITVSKEKNNSEAWFVQKYKLDYNGIICYRERLGAYSSFTYVGYNNAFNYFRLKKSNYDDKNFQNFGYFFLLWGHISYSNLPLAYQNILGVSGTLMTLNDHEKNAIKKNGIETISAMPSFFGERKLDFNPNEHFSIQDTVSNWHSKIFDHISKITQANRAVLVFFDTDGEIKEFENKYRNNINRLYTLIGNEEPETLEWRINEAGVALTVTLATRAMGRGIDYKSNDRGVEENGGMHAIQTCFSLDKKEETQMMGRVARKDNKGSYELILCREHLKAIGCNEKSDGTLIHTYQELCDARLTKANSMGAAIETKIKESEREHNLTMSFLNSLIASFSSSFTPEERKKFLSKYPFVKLDE